MVFKALALLKHRIESEIRERNYAKKQRLDTLAVHRVLSDNELVDKVAGVYLNGRKPMSGKDLFLSGREITLNCATFYGGTFENCKFVNVGSDEALLSGNHLLVSGSNFYGIKFTKEDNDALMSILDSRLSTLEKQKAFFSAGLHFGGGSDIDARNAATLESLEESILMVLTLRDRLLDEKQQTAIHITEGGN